MTAGHQLGIGVVGAGRWAGLAHLPGWARDGRCRIVGICDRDPERAAAAAERYRPAVVTGDYRVLLDRDDDGLRVQEVINAVEISHHERRWVSLPLDGPGDGAGDGAGDGEAAR